MSFFDDILVPGFVMVVGMFILVGGVMVGDQIYNLIVQPTIVATVDGNVVYQGSAACLDESSLGSATHIQIGRGPLCLFPGAKYTSHDVHVEPVK